MAPRRDLVRRTGVPAPRGVVERPRRSELRPASTLAGEAARRARNADRFPSGRFKLTTYVCDYCGSRSEGARARDIHAASHMLRRPGWYKAVRFAVSEPTLFEHQQKTMPVIRGGVGFGHGAAAIYENERELMNLVYKYMSHTPEWRDLWNSQAAIWGTEYDPMIHSTPTRYRNGIHNCIGLHGGDR